MKKETEENKHFLLLKQKIYKDTTLDINQYKNNYLKRRINVRMRARETKTYGEYYRLLSFDPSEYENLMKDLTINVTQFYRDPEVFQVIKDEIIPLIVFNNVKRQRRTIRVLSVGCSSGEEVYSLAILLHDLLDEEFNNFNVSINGIDIDDTSLKLAKKGRYFPQQVGEIKKQYLERYFNFDGEMYEISDEIKSIIRFKNQDIFEGKFRTHYNVIVCRNVMIYLTKEMQDKLFVQFYNSLVNGGYLIIGKTETLVGETKDKFFIVNNHERIYQKREKSIEENFLYS